MRYTAHMASVLGLLAVCVVYGAVVSIYCEKLATFAISDVLEYAVTMWGIAGMAGVIVGGLYLFDNRKCHLIYITWIMAIPFVEVFLAIRLFGEHWILPISPESV